MNTKLLLFGMFVMILLVSIPTAEAGWISDTWQWLMDLLGLSEEEMGQLINLGYYTDDFPNPDGSRTLTIWGGIRNVRDTKGDWKKIEDADSWKSAFDDGIMYINYLKDDSIHDFELVDANLTSLKIKPVLKDSKELNKDIPLKFDGKIISNVNLASLKGDTYEFSNGNILAHNYTFGSASTTITIGWNETGILDDAVPQNGTHDDGNWGDNRATGQCTTLNFEARAASNTDAHLFIRGNISEVPSGQAIDDAVLGWFVQTGGSPTTIEVRDVFNTTWKEGIAACNTQINDSSDVGITGENNPCYPKATGVWDEDECNSTFMDKKNILATGLVWQTFDITDAVTRVYAAGEKNVSVMIMRLDNNVSNENIVLRAKEYATGQDRPYINVTYSSVSPTDPSPIVNSTISGATNYTNETIACNFLCDDPQGGSITYDIYWYNNNPANTFNMSFTDVSCASTPLYISEELQSGNTSRGDLWACSVNITDDGSHSSATVFSENISIESYPPQDIEIVDPSLPNATTIGNYTSPTFNCSAIEDIDDDTIYYEFYYDLDTNPPTTTLGNSTTALTPAVGTFTVDGDYWWYCRPVDEYGGIGDSSDTRLFKIDNSTLKNQSADFETNTTSGKLELFEFNVSFNDVNYDYIDAKMVYSGTPYSLTQVNTSSATTRFYTSFNIPEVSITTSVAFYLNVSLFYYNGTEISEVTDPNWTQQIEPIGIKDCTDDPTTNTTQALAVNYTFSEEDTKTRFFHIENETSNLSSFEATFILYKDDISKNNTFSLIKTNIHEVDICISPPYESYNVNGQIEYKNDSYYLRNHYYDKAAFDNTTQNTTLYLLSTTDADLVTITVQDKSQAVQEEVYISVQRYDVGTNIFDLVAMGRSDFDGQDIIPLRLNDAWYRFILTKDQETKYIDSNSRRLDSTTLTLTMDESTIADDLRNFDTMDYTITNTSNSIILTFNDVSGASSKNCLTVYRTNTSNSGFVCYGEDYCLSSSSGTITCNIVGNIGDEGGVYIWRYFSTINPTKLVASGTISGVSRAIIEAVGVVGLLGAFLIILSMGLAGVSQRKVSYVVIFTFIGVFASRLLGLLDVSYVWIALLGILGGIVIVVTKD